MTDMLSTDHSLAPLTRAMTGHDAEAMAACLALDAVLRSPITDRIVFRGRAAIAALVVEVWSVLGDREIVAVVSDARHEVIHVRSTLQGRPLEEAIVLRLGADGLVTELTLLIRPMPALVSLAATLAPRLAPTRLRRVTLRVLFGPIAALLRRGEPLGLALTGAGEPPPR